MATASTSTSPCAEETHTCSVCLEPFRDPKFLPCYHTFCAQCITRLHGNSRRRDGKFPCPSCRQLTALPDGGSAALQSNFYINTLPVHVTAPLKRKMCSAHDEKVLEFYCVKCDKAICLNCKLTDCEKHKARSLNQVAKEKKSRLLEEAPRLQEASDKMEEHLQRWREDQNAVRDKTSALERNIRNRHAVLVAAADKFRDEALLSLQKVSADMDTVLRRGIERQENHKEELQGLQERLDQTLRDGTFADIVVLDRSMKKGPGSEKAVRKLVSAKPPTASRPVLYFTESGDFFTNVVKSFLGTPTPMTLGAEHRGFSARAERMFNCGLHEQDVEVFSLCVVSTVPKEVWVSFSRRGFISESHELCFGEHGGVQTTGERKGRITYNLHDQEALLRSPAWNDGDDFFRSTFCKSHDDNHLLLTSNDFGDDALIKDFSVTSQVPLRTKEKVKYKITVKLHLAFDADEDEELLAVVEEGGKGKRNVKLFHPPQKLPVATYHPSLRGFQPTDVCFYRLGGKPVLLVTCEQNDVIHVVTIHRKGWKMEFKGYLAPGCPFLVQPTALNVDAENTVWVACRGGEIITLRPDANNRENNLGDEEEENSDSDDADDNNEDDDSDDNEEEENEDEDLDHDVDEDEDDDDDDDDGDDEEEEDDE